MKIIEEVNALLYIILYFFKLIGIKTTNDLKSRFGDPDISMPFNSKKIEWTKAIQNICRKKNLNIKSLEYKLIIEENNQKEKNLITHIWFLCSNRHIIIVKEYNVGEPKISLAQCKLNFAIKR